MAVFGYKSDAKDTLLSLPIFHPNKKRERGEMKSSPLSSSISFGTI
jgi:hypothetical protein